MTTGPVSLDGYQQAANATDKLATQDLQAPILGLFGEVGSLLSVPKKHDRDFTEHAAYAAGLVEELGDVLYYLTILATRARVAIHVLGQRMSRDIDDWNVVDPHGPATFGALQTRTPQGPKEVRDRLVDLAGRVGDFVNDFRRGELSSNRDFLSGHLLKVLTAVVAVADAAGVSLDDVAGQNLAKIASRWATEATYPPLFDEGMPENERFMRRFTIEFEECEVRGKTFVIQKCNGIIVGDRLTDNKTEQDDYRFHDVFHIAYAVHLGWSPVLRALFRLKRKSRPELDENQDGARAIIIEEGVSTLAFGRGLRRNLFEGVHRVEYDLLKFVREFVTGYEVDQCGLWQWERAILDGFRLFRLLKQHRRGAVTADLVNHTLEFEERPASALRMDTPVT